MKAKQSPKTRHIPRRSPGQATATISLSAETLAQIRHLAAEEDRTLSNWIRRLIERSLAAESLAETTNAPPLTSRAEGTYTAPKRRRNK